MNNKQNAMSNWNDTLKIWMTNWINVAGIFLSTIIYTFIDSLMHQPSQIFLAIFVVVLSIFLYGGMFWIMFLIEILILDLILIRKARTKLKAMLIVEWLLISSPFIYWIIIYKEGIFLVAVIAFLVTQLLRAKRIREINS